MRRIKMLIVSMLVAASAAALAPAAQAMECVGVRGVLRYCPGRHCITDPCLVDP